MAKERNWLGIITSVAILSACVLIAVIASAENTPVVTPFPQSPQDGRQYLANLQVPASSITVAQAPAGSVEASGTPTLIVVDRKGRVVRFWVGKLPPRGESEMLQQLHS